MKNKNQIIKSFKIPFLSEVEAIVGKHISNEFRRHIHKTYIIGIVEQGKRIISYSNDSKTISEGEIFIINPKQVHSCMSESSIGHSYKLLSIPPFFMQLTASHISERHEEIPFFSCVHINDRKLSQKLLKLFDIIENSESDIQIESNFYDFVTGLLISYSITPLPVSDTQKQNDSIARACKYIHTHYSDNLSLKELASIACLSPFHFQREFKRFMGITPHEYLNDFRIGKSKKLLIEDNEIVDIANRLGFSDQSHFSRIFLKTVGVTPGIYKSINKNC
jgi:AraC-like DNA-binding protein